MATILGIDVGGTGIKGALVDVKTGELVSEKLRVPTPESGKPKEMLKVITDIVQHFNWKSKPIGIGFPAIMKDGVAYSASNIHDDWIGFDIKGTIEKKTKCPVVIINDADAAGIAELKFGKAKGAKGTVLLLTLGTGIGSALFTNGVLVPNTEFGHLYFRDGIAEQFASNAARKKKELTWEKYGKELNNFLKHVDFIFSPDLILLGGGISKRYHFYEEFISDTLHVEPAKNFNNAGIIGAAMAYKEFA